MDRTRTYGGEDIYKIYAESFLDASHLRRIEEEARTTVSAAPVKISREAAANLA